MAENLLRDLWSDLFVSVFIGFPATMHFYACSQARGRDATRPTICTSARRLAQCRLDRVMEMRQNL